MTFALSTLACSLGDQSSVERGFDDVLVDATVAGVTRTVSLDVAGTIIVGTMRGEPLADCT